jgi:hypothetical protein
MSIKKHLIEYVFIIIYFSFLIYFFQNLGSSPSARYIFAASLPTFYLLWAVAHHLFEERLKLHVFLEYLSISLFVFIILLTASNL